MQGDSIPGQGIKIPHVMQHNEKNFRKVAVKLKDAYSLEEKLWQT